MKIQLEHSFRDYIDSGDETTHELLESGSPLVAAIEEFDAFFRDDMWAGDQEMPPNQSLLSMNAYMIYLCAVRVAMTGHEAAIFPLFRTALESACYAFLMSKDESLQEIWSNRHQSAAAMKLCRGRFTSAVIKTAHAIEAAEQRKGIAKVIIDCYQSAIDFGAHPNPRSIFHHVSASRHENDNFELALVGLYTSDSIQTSRSLIVCLDYGLIIAIVLAHGLNSPTQELSDKLSKLNDTKEQLIKTLFPEAYEAVKAS